jgi:hypothetical protein
MDKAMVPRDQPALPRHVTGVLNMPYQTAPANPALPAVASAAAAEAVSGSGQLS